MNIYNWKLVTGNWKLIKGFTLIELLIVMVVLGSLAGIIVVRFPASQKRARDTQRKSDIKQYQTALEVYANKKYGFYPSRTSSTQADTTLCTDLGLSTDCSADPKDGSTTACGAGNTCRYYYISNGSGTPNIDATQYVLWGALEQPTSTANPFFIVCSNGKSKEGTAPASSACPI